MQNATLRIGLRILIYTMVTLVIFIGYYHVKIASIKKQDNYWHLAVIGNDLSAYFYYINTYLPENICKKIKNHEQLIVDDVNIKKLYNKFVCEKSKVLWHYSSYYNSAWNQLEFGGMYKNNYLPFWQSVRPLVNEFYKKNIANKNIITPVVHFRCSDSPFNKQVQYHMTKYESVKWMAQQIKDRGYDEIIMLSCNKHYSLDKNSCVKYTEFYQNIFNDAGLKVAIQCNSSYEDFALMVNAPLLVSLNASSYSFMAGIAKDPKNYISCNMGVQDGNKYFLQNAADWIMDYRAPLLHTDALDYNDYAAVIEKLRS